MNSVFNSEGRRFRPLIANVRWRMLCVFGLLSLFVSLPYVSVLTVACVSMMFVLWWSGIELPTVFKRLLLIVPFALGALIFLPFTTPGTSAIEIFAWTATFEGLQKSLLILLKIVIANLLLTWLLTTTGSFELIKNLRALGVPPLLTSMMQMTVRYFYLLLEEVQSMLKAQRARGLSPEKRWWSKRMYLRLGELLGVLFIRADVRSRKIHQAMAARGGVSVLEADQVVDEQAYEQQTQTELVRMALELRNVSFNYGERAALQNVSFRLIRGARTVLLGANGAGKSTLISLLNGLAVPVAGEVLLFNQPLDASNRTEARRRVGVVYQDPDDQIFSATVEEDVAFGPRNQGLSEIEVQERVERALGAVGMREYRNHSPFELSYGQKRRVAIAGVLAMQPEVMVMDEPMAFLDPQGRADLQDLLESLHLMGLTILIATHDLDFAAEWADEVLILQKGTVYASGSAELLFNENLLAGAGLPLPRLAQPFRLLRDVPTTIRPRSVREAAQAIWRLMMQRPDASDESNYENNVKTNENNR